MFTMIKRVCLLSLCFLSLATLSHASGEAKLPAPAVKLLTDKTAYSSGEPVKMTMIVINQSRADANLLFGSGQSYDVMVTGKSHKLVWHWSHNKVFTMAVRNVKIPAGQNIRYEIAWPQRDDRGRPVKPGKYFIRGRLTSALQLDSPDRTVIIK